MKNPIDFDNSSSIIDAPPKREPIPTQGFNNQFNEPTKQPMLQGKLTLEEFKQSEFYPGQNVSFKIIVTNTGNVNFTKKTIILASDYQGNDKVLEAF